MAKLNGVSVVAEKITYSGVEYVKTDKDAEAGDIVRCEDDGYLGAELGEYFEVGEKKGVIYFTDNDGDERGFTNGLEHRANTEDFTVFTKAVVSAPGSVTYSEVERKASVGERIRIVDRYSGERRYENGDEFVAIEDWGGVTNAEIGEVTAVREGGKVTVKWPSFGSGWSGIMAELDVVTPEEAKWSAIGRKVGEFKAGDIVEFAEPDGYNALTKGDVGTVGETNRLGWVRVNTKAVKCGNWCEPKELRLIAPVESLFNSAINSASTAN